MGMDRGTCPTGKGEVGHHRRPRGELGRGRSVEASDLGGGLSPEGHRAPGSKANVVASVACLSCAANGLG